MATVEVANRRDAPAIIHDNIMQVKRSPSGNVLLPLALQKYAITDVERSKIEEIKSRLSDVITPRYDDIRICRFLRREKEVASTESMIRREMKWRETARPDKVFEDFPKSKYFNSLIKYWPGDLHGVDQYGVPFYCERLGQIDLHSLLGVVPAEVLIQYHIWCIERNDRIISEAFQRLGAPVGHVYIMDLSGLSIRHYNTSAIDILKQIQAIDDNNYPEFLRKVLVINAPTVFSMFWKIAKVVMHKQSAAKFEVMKGEYLNEIKNHINDDNIPRFLGGHCTKCPHFKTECKYGGGKFEMIKDH